VGCVWLKKGFIFGWWSEWVSEHVCFCSVDPFSKKDWYDIKAPSTFNQRSSGKTLVTRTQGTKVRMRKNNRCVLLSVLYSALLLGEHLYGRLVRDVGDVYTS
jgi:hypothetical protein